MSPRDALMDACYAVRGFRYIPDTVTTPEGIVVPVDVWDTLSEFETRRGGDCDGFACWAIERAEKKSPGSYYFVAGEVLQRGQWNGHAWVELQTEDAILWADPTWGFGPMAPSSLGYSSAPTKSTRRPVKRWHYAGEGLFDREDIYPPEAA